jgi:hypothetical protein
MDERANHMGAARAHVRRLRRFQRLLQIVVRGPVDGKAGLSRRREEFFPGPNIFRWEAAFIPKSGYKVLPLKVTSALE